MENEDSDRDGHLGRDGGGEESDDLEGGDDGFGDSEGEYPRKAVPVVDPCIGEGG